jgi:methyl-accepting chemotaxis protein
MSEFFRYHGLWSPGVRLFRSIGFRSKALVITTVFLVPILLLSWNYFSNQKASIDFSAKERLGVLYARDVLPLLKLMQQQRLLAVQAAAKDQASPDLGPLRGELDAQLARLAAVDKALGAELGTGKAFSALLAAAKAATAATGGGEVVFAAHVASVQSLLDLLGAASDGSNLTLDPDIDTYYLMDVALSRLPAMTEAAAQTRGLGAAALMAGSTTAPRLRRIIEQVTLLSSNQSAMESGIGKAVAYNADVGAQTNSDAAKAAGRSYLARLDVLMARTETTPVDPAEHVASANQAIDAMFKLADSSLQTLDRLIAERVSRLETNRNITAAVMFIALTLSLYLFICFGKVLGGGLREVAFHIDAMRDGDLTTQPRAWGADEAAGLMHTLSAMQASLRRIVLQVRGASDSIVHASSEISTGSLDLSSRTEQSAASLEETASAMEQISATVRNNEDALKEATQLALTNADGADRGGQIIAQVVATMQQINASSGRIGDIIGTIDSIAFQTNILALNAAIEAARAGEQGRGFAVVASEVRALAQRSSGAAREIKALINHSVEQADNGSRVVQAAGTAIDEIVSTARRVRELLDDVAAGAREQTLGIAQSAKAVQELDTATQQNAALVEETAAAAASLKDQALSLSSEVAQFKLPAT